MSLVGCASQRCSYLDPVFILSILLTPTHSPFLSTFISVSKTSLKVCKLVPRQIQLQPFIIETLMNRERKDVPPLQRKIISSPPHCTHTQTHARTHTLTHKQMAAHVELCVNPTVLLAAGLGSQWYRQPWKKLQNKQKMKQQKPCEREPD